MARGWESKSVEEQQAESMKAPGDAGRRQLTPQELIKRREHDELSLARRSVLQQLETAQNPRHRKMLWLNWIRAYARWAKSMVWLVL
jgi:hypothetical protein